MPADRSKSNAGPQDRIPGEPGRPPFEAPGALEVALPGGGRLTVNTPDEKVLWEETAKRYIKDYRITKTNDLILLGALLSQVLVLYRAQKELVDEKKAAAAQAMITKAADEIRKGEKALGIDKATREKGGQQTVADFITRLKRAAYEKGVHISNRVKEYERVAMEARWKIRLLRNGDPEDQQYHRISEKSIIDWLEKELAKLEEADKTWAKEKAAVWVGKL